MNSGNIVLVLVLLGGAAFYLTRNKKKIWPTKGGKAKEKEPQLSRESSDQFNRLGMYYLELFDPVEATRVKDEVIAAEKKYAEDMEELNKSF